MQKSRKKKKPALVSLFHRYFWKRFSEKEGGKDGNGGKGGIRGASVAGDIVLEANWKPPEKQPTPKRGRGRDREAEKIHTQPLGRIPKE